MIRETMLTGSRDTDDYLLKNILTDDGDFFNTILTNKTYFEKGKRILEEKIRQNYPSVIKFKRETETWPRFYFRTMKSIYELKTVGINYPTKWCILPPCLYIKDGYSISYINILRFEFSVYENDTKGVLYLLDELMNGDSKKFAYYLKISLQASLTSENTKIYSSIIEKYGYKSMANSVLRNLVCDAIYTENKEVISYMFDEYIKVTGLSPINFFERLLTKSNFIYLFEKYIEKCSQNYIKILNSYWCTVPCDNMEVIKYILNSMKTNNINPDEARDILVKIKNRYSLWGKTEEEQIILNFMRDSGMEG